MPTLEVTCLCGAYNDTVETISGLPVNKMTCSCDSCRYVTGVLYVSCPSITRKPGGIDNLQSYNTSEKLTRYSCSTCGSPLFIRTIKDDSWLVYAGAIERVVGSEQVSSAIEKYVEHEFVGDTLDGGLVLCLAQSKAMPPTYYLQEPDGEPVQIDPFKRPSPFITQNQDSNQANQVAIPQTRSTVDKLHASCHCGGVQFYITRPNEMSRKCSSPWPDLIIPDLTGLGANPDDVKWWMRTEDTKYLAGTCACKSCRLSSGCPIQTWAFVPKANISKLDGSPLDFNLGTLQQYNSFPDRYREFCRKCGASVFWHCGARPDLIDISVGLLRAPEGARAENWLEWWTERVSFREDAFDKELVDEIEKGLPLLSGKPAVQRTV